jgi:hypothetical protein
MLLKKLLQKDEKLTKDFLSYCQSKSVNLECLSNNTNLLAQLDLFGYDIHQVFVSITPKGLDIYEGSIKIRSFPKLTPLDIDAIVIKLFDYLSTLHDVPF